MLYSNSLSLKKKQLWFPVPAITNKINLFQLKVLRHRLPLSCFLRKSLSSTLHDRILHSILLRILNRGYVCLCRDSDKSQLGCVAWRPPYASSRLSVFPSNQAFLSFILSSTALALAVCSHPALNHLLAGLPLQISNISNYLDSASNFCLLKQAWDDIQNGITLY